MKTTNKTFWHTLLTMTILLLSSCASSDSSESSSEDTGSFSDSWCIGKWTGQLNTRMHEKYAIRIKEDHTCTIKSEWFWQNVRSADFEADWEPVSDDVIKIYDYDGHNENLNGFRGIYQQRISRWSMYLRKDGAFSHEQSQLNNPEGYLKKK